MQIKQKSECCRVEYANENPKNQQSSSLISKKILHLTMFNIGLKMIEKSIEKGVKRNTRGQFRKGTISPNPNGRPKSSISKVLREFMHDKDCNNFSRIQHICLILWEKALKGDLHAINLIFNRVDGPPQNRLNI